MSLCISLEELPAELLSHIVTHFDVVKTLVNLALTCKRLHEFVERDGFRLFVQHKFPSIQTPPYWKEAVHALTSSSKAWDRKAFVARSIKPKDCDIFRLPLNREPPRSRVRQHGHGQTMGYQPVIDSYQEVGDSWTSGLETLAWGAGAELIIRSTSLTDRLVIKWKSYKENEHRDGKHDITSLNLLRPSQWPSDYDEDTTQLIIGRANGSLNRVHLTSCKSEVVMKYTTKSRPVRSTALSDSSTPLFAAGLSDNIIAIYEPNSATGNALGEIPVIPNGKAGRTWSTRFLNRNRLAVGLGPSSKPLHVYEIAPDRIPAKPLREFSSSDCSIQLSEGDDGATSGRLGYLASSVYSIVPLGTSSSAGGADGDLFLSGWFNGSIRLHDIRSPTPYCAVFDDPMDNSPIYSLLAVGRERFLAGAGRNCVLKGFDLRVAGGRTYYASDLVHPCPNQPPARKSKKRRNFCCSYHYGRFHRRNFNLYVIPSCIAGVHKPRYRNPQDYSPIYSLSSPSVWSPTIYVGVEEAVVQIDTTSLSDKFPDPIFGKLPDPVLRSVSSGPNRWPCAMFSADVINLAIQEQSTIGNIPLKKQTSMAPLPSSRKFKEYSGWDERWERPCGI